jgi:antitoxin (DNA-binding transcriptional repressor) of toxin-antitoxin stability system
MQQLNIRQMRNLLGKLDQLVEQEQEIIIIRHKQPIARILPIQTVKKRPSHAELRQLTQTMSNSATLIRADRDER